MRAVSVALVSASIAACGAEPIRVPPPSVLPEPLLDPTPSAECGEPRAGTLRASGEVSGFWSNRVELAGEVVVASGARLELCPGTTLVPLGADSKLVVRGELRVSGRPDALVTVEEIAWAGVEVEGKMSGGYLSLASAALCIEGGERSEIELLGTRMLGCGTSFALKNGARFDRVTVLGGATAAVTGGMLTMTDSLVDLRHPTRSPDCLYWSGGGGVLAHVRVTGCHCPLHVNRAPEGFAATGSIFDGAAVPIMIAETIATFSGNDILEGSPQVLDIGGGLEVELAGNYWGGGAPSIGTDNASQFRGADTFATAPIPGAGPR